MELFLTAYRPFMRTMLRYRVRRARVDRSEQESFKRPSSVTLPYEVPEYKEEMPFCKSKEKYLKPTRLCECRAPEIIAMANQLGAFKQPDREYAEACFDWVNHNIKPGITLHGALATLKEGRGDCADRTSLFIALCRTGGVPARYRMSREAISEQYFDETSQHPGREVLGALGFDVVPVAQVKIGDEWIVCGAPLVPALAALGRVPIAHFGEDPTGYVTFRLGTASIVEGLGYNTLMTRIFRRMMGGFASVNELYDEQYEKGRKLLDEIGEEEYDKSVRASYRFTMPKVILDKGITGDMPGETSG